MAKSVIGLSSLLTLWLSQVLTFSLWSQLTRGQEMRCRSQSSWPLRSQPTHKKLLQGREREREGEREMERGKSRGEREKEIERRREIGILMHNVTLQVVH